MVATATKTTAFMYIPEFQPQAKRLMNRFGSFSNTPPTIISKSLGSMATTRNATNPTKGIRFSRC